MTYFAPMKSITHQCCFFSFTTQGWQSSFSKNNLYQLFPGMEIQSLQPVVFIPGAWILREIVKCNWYHMLFIAFHMKESWFSADHGIMLWPCSKSSNSKVTCDEGAVIKTRMACIISPSWKLTSVCLSKTQPRHFLGFSTVYKAYPCKLLEAVQENVQIFITRQQDYKTPSFQRVHQSQGNCFSHCRNVSNDQTWK